MSRRKPLELPDKKQCQAEKISYRPFIMGGDVNQRERCPNVPAWLAKDKYPGTDGRKGSMSLCDDCKKVLVKQFTVNKQPLPNFTKLRVKGDSRAESR